MTLLPAAVTSPISGRLSLPSLRIFCVWSGTVSSAYATLIVSPGESLTAVLGPGGFGRGGSGLWQPHASAAKTKKGKRQEDALNSRLREDLPAKWRLSHNCLLFCTMQRCLL